MSNRFKILVLSALATLSVCFVPEVMSQTPYTYFNSPTPQCATGTASENATFIANGVDKGSYEHSVNSTSGSTWRVQRITVSVLDENTDVEKVLAVQTTAMTNASGSSSDWAAAGNPVWDPLNPQALNIIGPTAGSFVQYVISNGSSSTYRLGYGAYRIKDLIVWLNNTPVWEGDEDLDGDGVNDMVSCAGKTVRVTIEYGGSPSMISYKFDYDFDLVSAPLIKDAVGVKYDEGNNAYSAAVCPGDDIEFALGNGKYPYGLAPTALGYVYEAVYSWDMQDESIEGDAGLHTDYATGESIFASGLTSGKSKTYKFIPYVEFTTHVGTKDGPVVGGSCKTQMGAIRIQYDAPVSVQLEMNGDQTYAKTVCQGEDVELVPTFYKEDDGDYLYDGYAELYVMKNGSYQLVGSFYDLFDASYVVSSSDIPVVDKKNTTYNYKYVVYDQTYNWAESSCRYEQEFNITVKEMEAQIKFPESVEAVCEDGDVSLSATVSGANMGDYVCTWSGVDCSPNFDPSATSGAYYVAVVDKAVSFNGGSRKYRLTVSNGGCEVYDDVTVTSYERPVLTPVTTPVEVCKDEEAVLEVTSSQPNVTISWHEYSEYGSNDGTASADGLSNTIIGSNDKTYYVTAINEHGCTTKVPAQIVVTVNPQPDINYLADATMCEGGSVTLSATAAAGTAPFIFYWSWKENGVDKFATTTSSTSTGTYDFSPSENITAETAYDVTVYATDSKNCTKGKSATGKVTVSPKPEFIVTPADGCADGKATLTFAETIGTGLSYVVTPIDGGSGSLSGDVYTVNGSGQTSVTTYNYSIVATVGSCESDPVPAQLTVYPKPAVSASVNDNNICLGEEVSLTASATGVNFTWSADNAAAGLVSTSGSSVKAKPTAAGTYIYTVTVKSTTSPYCENTTTVSVTVNSSPTVTIDASSSVICEGGSATLTANVTGGLAPYTYTWSNGATSSSITVSPTSTTEYSVTVTDANSCPVEGATDSKEITVSKKPVFTVSVSPDVCAGSSDEVTFTINQTNSSESTITKYTYNGTETTASPFPYSETWSGSSKTFTVIAYAGSCASDSRTATVNIHPIPAKPEVTSSPAAICKDSGKEVTLSVSSPVAGYRYVWSTGEVGTSIKVKPNETTTYSVQAFDDNFSTKCPSPEAEVTVTVNELPSVTISGDTEVCEGGTVTLTANATGGSGVYTTYIWTGGTASSKTTSSIDETLTSDATYTVKVVDNGGCESVVSAPYKVTVNKKPIVTLVANPSSVCEGVESTVTLTPSNSATGAQNVTYTWSNANISLVGGVYQLTSTWSADETITVHATSTGCPTPVDADAVISVVSKPAKPVVDPIKPICKDSGESRVLSITSANTTTYNYIWYDKDMVKKDENKSTFTVSPNVSTKYFVRQVLKGSNACESDLTEINVEVVDVPVKPEIATSSATYCSDDIASGITLEVKSPVAGLTYTWYNKKNDSEVGTGSSITVTPSAGETSYYVIALNSNDCSSEKSADVKFTVNQSPILSADLFDSQLCQVKKDEADVVDADKTEYSVSVDEGDASKLHFYWTINGSAAADGVGMTSFAYAHTVAGSVTVSVYAEDESSSCTSNTVDYVVNIVAAPTYTITPVDRSICEGESIDLTISTNAGDPDIFVGNKTTEMSEPDFSDQANGQGYWGYVSPVTKTLTPVVDTDYYIWIYDYVSSCQTIEKFDIDIFSNPELDYTGNTSTCIGGSINYTASAKNGETYTYEWYKGSVSESNKVSTSATLSITGATLADAGDYILNVNNGHCDATVKQPIEIYSEPTPKISSNDFVCFNSSIDFETDEYKEYEWQIDGVVKSTEKSFSFDASSYAAGSTFVVSLVVKDSQDCSNSTPVTKTISVRELPVISSVSDTEYCFNKGGKVVLTPSLSNKVSTSTYEYTFTDPKGNNYESESVSLPISKDLDGHWTVSVVEVVKVIEENKFGCAIAKPFDFDVMIHDAELSLDDSGYNVFCAGKAGTYSVKTVVTSDEDVADFTYHIKISDSTIDEDFDGTYTNASISSLSVGSHEVEVTATSKFGCEYVENLSLTILETPQAIISVDNETPCFGDPVVLTINDGIAAPKVTIYVDGSIYDNVVNKADLHTYTLNIADGASHDVYVFVGAGSSDCSKESDHLTVKSYDEIVGDLSPKSSTIIAGSAINFSATAGYENYEFFIGSESKQNSSSNTFTATGIDSDVTVKVIVTNNGCSVEWSSEVTVLEGIAAKEVVVSNDYYCSDKNGVTISVLDPQVGITYVLKECSSCSAIKCDDATTEVKWDNIKVLPGETTSTYSVTAYHESLPDEKFAMANTVDVTEVYAPQKFNMTPDRVDTRCDANELISIDGSELNVFYALMLNESTQIGDVKAGTGSAIDFEVVSAIGKYTVKAYSIYEGAETCPVTMNGSYAIDVKDAQKFIVSSLPSDGNYCAGSDGVEIRLSGSEDGYEYQLLRDGIDVDGKLITGDGSNLSFGKVTDEGVYTVMALFNGCKSLMKESVNVVKYNKPVDQTLSVSNYGHYCEGSTGVTITLGNQQDGFIYSLYCNGVLVAEHVGDDSNSSYDFTDMTTVGNYTMVVSIPGIEAACETVLSSSVNVYLDKLPQQVTLTAVPATICRDEFSYIQVNGTEENVEYQLYQNGVYLSSLYDTEGSARLRFEGINGGGTQGDYIYTVKAIKSITVEDGINTVLCPVDMDDDAELRVENHPLDGGENEVVREALDTELTVKDDPCYGAEIIIENAQVSESLTFIYKLYRKNSDGTWSFRTSFVATGDPVKDRFLNIQDNNGVYHVGVDNGYCEDVLSTEINILSDKFVTVQEVSVIDHMCQGDMGNDVRLLAAEDGVIYRLYNENGSLLDTHVATSAAGFKFDYQVYNPGHYYVTGAKADGCEIKMIPEFDFTVNPLPISYSLVGDTHYCDEIGVQLKLNSSELDVEYALYRVEGDELIRVDLKYGTGSEFAFKPVTNGVYVAAARNEITGCTSSMEGELNISKMAPIQTRECTSVIPSSEYVDLGLPNGTLWAVKDLGAADEFTAGNKYTWENRASDITAPWSVPTLDQINDLYYHCTWEYDAARHGYKVIGKNGNSIFLPYNYHDEAYVNCYYGSFWSDTEMSSTDNLYVTDSYGVKMDNQILSYSDLGNVDNSDYLWGTRTFSTFTTSSSPGNEQSFDNSYAYTITFQPTAQTYGGTFDEDPKFYLGVAPYFGDKKSAMFPVRPVVLKSDAGSECVTEIVDCKDYSLTYNDKLTKDANYYVVKDDDVDSPLYAITSDGSSALEFVLSESGKYTIYAAYGEEKSCLVVYDEVKFTRTYVDESVIATVDDSEVCNGIATISIETPQDGVTYSLVSDTQTYPSRTGLGSTIEWQIAEEGMHNYVVSASLSGCEDVQLGSYDVEIHKPFEKLSDAVIIDNFCEATEISIEDFLNEGQELVLGATYYLVKEGDVADKNNSARYEVADEMPKFSVSETANYQFYASYDGVCVTPISEPYKINIVPLAQFPATAETSCDGVVTVTLHGYEPGVIYTIDDEPGELRNDKIVWDLPAVSGGSETYVIFGSKNDCEGVLIAQTTATTIPNLNPAGVVTSVDIVGCPDYVLPVDDVTFIYDATYYLVKGINNPSAGNLGFFKYDGIAPEFVVNEDGTYVLWASYNNECFVQVKEFNFTLIPFQNNATLSATASCTAGNSVVLSNCEPGIEYIFNGETKVADATGTIKWALSSVPTTEMTIYAIVGDCGSRPVLTVSNNDFVSDTFDKYIPYAVVDCDNNSSITLYDSQEGVSYELRKNGAVVGSPLSGTAPLAWSGVEEGDYVVYATNADGCEFPMGVVTIQNRKSIAPIASIADMTVCSGVKTLVVAGQVGVTYYLVEAGNSVDNPVQTKPCTSGDVEFTLSKSATYKIYGGYDKDCMVESNEFVFNVSVGELPEVSFDGCGGNATITLSSSTEAVKYTVLKDNVVADTKIGTGEPIEFNIIGSGTFDFTVLASADGCDDVVIFNSTESVNKYLPDVETKSYGVPTCESPKALFTVFGEGKLVPGAYYYVVRRDHELSDAYDKKLYLDEEGATGLVFSIAAIGNFDIWASFEDESCARKVGEIDFSVAGVSDVDVIVTENCGESVTISISNTSSDYAYVIDGVEGSSWNITENGTYQIHAIKGTDCDFVVESIKVDLDSYAKPDTKLTVNVDEMAYDGTSVCSNSGFVFTATNVNEGVNVVSYIFSVNGVAYDVQDSNVFEPDLTPYKGIVTVSVDVITDAGCKFDGDKIKVSLLESASATGLHALNGVTSYCDDSEGILLVFDNAKLGSIYRLYRRTADKPELVDIQEPASDGENIMFYGWNGSNVANNTNGFAAVGTYFVVVTSPDNCSVTTNEVVIEKTCVTTNVNCDDNSSEVILEDHVPGAVYYINDPENIGVVDGARVTWKFTSEGENEYVIYRVQEGADLVVVGSGVVIVYPSINNIVADEMGVDVSMPENIVNFGGPINWAKQSLTSSCSWSDASNAAVSMGAGWSIPSADDCDELFSKALLTNTIDLNGNFIHQVKTDKGVISIPATIDENLVVTSRIWTSTEVDADNAVMIEFVNGVYNGKLNVAKSDKLSVHPVYVGEESHPDGKFTECDDKTLTYSNGLIKDVTYEFIFDDTDVVESKVSDGVTPIEFTMSKTGHYVVRASFDGECPKIVSEADFTKIALGDDVTVSDNVACIDASVTISNPTEGFTFYDAIHPEFTADASGSDIVWNILGSGSYSYDIRAFNIEHPECDFPVGSGSIDLNVLRADTTLIAVLSGVETYEYCEGDAGVELALLKPQKNTIYRLYKLAEGEDVHDELMDIQEIPEYDDVHRDTLMFNGWAYGSDFYKSFAEAGRYYIDVDSDNNCSFTTDTVEVIMNPLPYEESDTIYYAVTYKDAEGVMHVDDGTQSSQYGLLDAGTIVFDNAQQGIIYELVHLTDTVESIIDVQMLDPESTSKTLYFGPVKSSANSVVVIPEGEAPSDDSDVESGEEDVESGDEDSESGEVSDSENESDATDDDQSENSTPDDQAINSRYLKALRAAVIDEYKDVYTADSVVVYGEGYYTIRAIDPTTGCFKDLGVIEFVEEELVAYDVYMFLSKKETTSKQMLIPSYGRKGNHKYIDWSSKIDVAYFPDTDAGSMTVINAPGTPEFNEYPEGSGYSKDERKANIMFELLPPTKDVLVNDTIWSNVFKPGTDSVVVATGYEYYITETLDSISEKRFEIEESALAEYEGKDNVSIETIGEDDNIQYFVTQIDTVYYDHRYKVNNVILDENGNVDARCDSSAVNFYRYYEIGLAVRQEETKPVGTYGFQEYDFEAGDKLSSASKSGRFVYTKQPNYYGQEVINYRVYNTKLPKVRFSNTAKITVLCGNEAVGDSTSQFLIPNAFSPNGDGYNDKYVIIMPYRYQENSISKLEVFNRWGTLVYRSSGLQYGRDCDWWDGTSKTSNMLTLGDKLPSGTYFYVFTITFNDNDGHSYERKLNGYIELRR